MNRQQSRDRFQFNQNLAFHNHVGSESRLHGMSLVDDWQHHLALKREAAVFKLSAEALFVSRFKQPRPEGSMHLDRRADDLLWKRISVLHTASFD